MSRFSSYLKLNASDADINLPCPSVKNLKEYIRSKSKEIKGPGVIKRVITEHIKATYTEKEITRTDEHGFKFARLGLHIGLDETGLNPGTYKSEEVQPRKHSVDGQRDLAGLELDGQSRAKRR